jgi:hypothetical protein
LGNRALHGMEAEEGYIKWFYQVSHPRMILPNEEVPVPRPPEREDIDEIATEEDAEHGFLELGVSDTMCMLLCPVVRCSKGLRHDNI